jgi:hypothetical protein
LSADRKDRSAPPPGGAETVGAQVVALRSSGKSFPAIAQALNVGNVEAFSLFIDELGRRSPEEQAGLRAEESSRLDELERRARLHADADLRARRLASVKKLRRRLAAP